MIAAITIIGIALLILQDFFLWVFLKINFIDHALNKGQDGWPRVSVLVSARNEEIDLPGCLASLEKLNYPEDKLQYIIGDDQSGDKTPEIIKDWVKKGKNRHFVEVEPDQSGKINGKANALSQMAQVAMGDFYFFTDADCAVGPFWIQEMISAYTPQSGVVMGITAVRGASFFAVMQSIDWWITLGMVKVSADLHHPMTAMGNNMMVCQQAYWEIGGFEQVSFSVTEDVALAQALIGRGYQPIHQVSSKNLVMTKSEKSIPELLAQRKRWMSGVMSLPWYWVLLLALQAGFFPAILYFMFLSPCWGAGLWLSKVLVQSFFIREFAAKTETKISFFHLFCFELYYLFISWTTIVYYFWPNSIKWKERTYP